MITIKHLAIVRAALQFLDEELSPGDDGTLGHYLDPQSENLGLTTEDIKATRDVFSELALFHAFKQRQIDELDSVTLIPAASNDEAAYQADKVQLVSVLVAPASE